MTIIKRSFWGILALLTLLWVVAAPDFLGANGVFEWRNQMLQYSGVLAMGCFSVAMFLSIRPRWPEKPLGGLDKMYRLHKWLGIGAAVVAISHWLWVEAPKWAVQAGWLSRPQRGPRAPIENGLESALREYRHLAEGIGEWAFYIALLLVAAALIHRIPYGVFRKLHKLFPLAYLALVFHTVVLTEFDYWTTPLGLVLAVLLATGSYAAFVSLLGRIGAGRMAPSTLTEVEHFPGVRSARVTGIIGDGWRGHEPGQFAFVTSDRHEGAHPYTIASAWDPDMREITFVTKALGDHTSQVLKIVKPGMTGTIEGPYGCFTFDDDKPVQIWIGGGIGITPFIARMHHRIQKGDTHDVHLFHSTADVDETALAHLRELAEEAGVNLHILIAARDGHLTGDKVRDAVPNWRDASIWFCGPTGFGDAIRDNFAAAGFPVRQDFHQELFQMR
ncbi:ferric reductase-like transmembrane domain-containing protein [Shimia biformata]|uniref:ferredoxin reductase family protein n=1 Tax=Shimia biformata TaxID=1294299 RepID=UPI00194FE117|nr:ferric reductase-like transmembrane domain-containing protein [Shimia biformata]